MIICTVPLAQFCIKLMVLGFAISVFVQMAVDRWQHQPPPKNLSNTASRIAQGKVPRHIASALKAQVIGWQEHYRLIPGRLSCRVTPYHKNGEDIWALVVGLKETAASEAHRHVVIPVYSNGKIYDL